MIETNRGYSINSHMHYGNQRYIVGVIEDVPDSLPWAPIPTFDISSDTYNKISREIDSRIYSSKKTNEQKFPIILKVSLAVLSVAALILFGKNISNGLRTYFKNFLK